MLSRIFVGLFYALVFFALGAWAGHRVPTLRATLDQGAAAVSESAGRLWAWAQGTVGSDGTADGPKVDDAARPAVSLAAARAMFAKGNVSESIAAYQALLQARPADADAWGELGNVYHSSGRLQDASRAFYEAATRVLDKGDVARARALEPAVRANAPALADELQRRIEQAGAGASAAAAEKSI